LHLADDWVIWMTTTSTFWALQRLLKEEYGNIWENFGKGFLIHCQHHRIAAEQRQDVKSGWMEMALGCEKVIFNSMSCFMFHLSLN
jgi:hypothetical protein